MAEEKKHEPGHEFLARLGKTRLRPGGREATEWLLGHVDFTADTRVLEVACNMGTTMIALAEAHGCRITGLDMNPAALALNDDPARLKAWLTERRAKNSVQGLDYFF